MSTTKELIDRWLEEENRDSFTEEEIRILLNTIISLQQDSGWYFLSRCVTLLAAGDLQELRVAASMDVVAYLQGRLGAWETLLQRPEIMKENIETYLKGAE